MNIYKIRNTKKYYELLKPDNNNESFKYYDEGRRYKKNRLYLEEIFSGITIDCLIADTIYLNKSRSLEARISHEVKKTNGRVAWGFENCDKNQTRYLCDYISAAQDKNTTRTK